MNEHDREDEQRVEPIAPVPDAVFAEEPGLVDELPKDREPVAPPRRRGGGFALLLSFLALATAGATAYGGWWLWQQFGQLRQLALERSSVAAAPAAAPDPRLEQLLRSQEQINGRLGMFGRQLDSLGEAQRVQGEQLRQLPAERPQQPVTEGPDVLVAEVEFLLRIAEHQAAIGHDADGAMAALKAADNRLAESGDPALAEVRRALAEEMQVLSRAAAVDPAIAGNTLTRVAGAIRALPIDDGMPERYVVTESGERIAPKPWEDWRGFVDVAWSDLKSLVTIRRGGEAKLPLAAPDQAFFLRQNLLLKIDLARLALLQGEVTPYRDSLLEAKAWLDRYFDTTLPQVAAVVADIDALVEQPVTNQLPPLGTARATLARVERQRPVAAPVAAAPTPVASTPEPAAASEPEVEPAAATAESEPAPASHDEAEAAPTAPEAETVPATTPVEEEDAPASPEAGAEAAPAAVEEPAAAGGEEPQL